MGQGSWTRRTAAMIVAATLLAACSGSDDDGADPSTAPEPTQPPTETTGTTEPDDDALDGEGLAVGVLSPPPGLLSTLFRGQDRGMAFAVEDVDAAGGVLDGPLALTPFTPQPGSDITEAVTEAIDAGSSALIGPAGSDDAELVRDQLLADGGLTCSASASLPRVTLDQDGDDGDLSLVRTALSDDVMTTYLTRYIEDRRDEQAPDAAWTVAIVARDDDYGVSISAGLAATLQAAGMNPVVVGYDHRRVEFSGTAAEAAGVEADLTVLVSYSEGANLLTSLVRAGVDPATMIGLDAFFRARIASIASPGTDGDPAALDGFTLLGSMGDRAFLERLYEADENGEVSFASQAYDCAVLLALGTEAVALDEELALASAVVAVSGDGTTCTTYDDCLTKLRAGEDIDYDGVSGRIDFDEHGDPTWARFTTAVLQGGAITDITATDVDIAELRRQLEAYASAAQIAAVQQALRFLGFYGGPINGLDTEEYRAALAAFQASVGLPPTGIFDAATDAALRAALGPYADLLMATTEDIQRLLTDLGFYDGPIDGVWTDEVTEAIRALQRELGVPETGVIDAATLRAIYARGEADATTTTTTPDTTAPPTTTPPTTAPPTTAPPTTTPPPTTPPPTVPPTTTPPTPPTTTTPLPPIDKPTLLEVLQAEPEFSMFVQLVFAVDASGFEIPEQLTVFAPTDDAILAAVSEEEFEELLADPAAAQAVLAYHVVDGRLPTSALTDGLQLTALHGETLAVTNDGSTITVGGAPIDPSRENLEAINGIVQGLTELLMPPA
jgi:branched-chain amino acid transport system substrate-binding protein